MEQNHTLLSELCRGLDNPSKPQNIYRRLYHVTVVWNMEHKGTWNTIQGKFRIMNKNVKFMEFLTLIVYWYNRYVFYSKLTPGDSVDMHTYVQ